MVTPVLRHFVISSRVISAYTKWRSKGYDIEDVYDEIGLGMNNHLASKPIQKSDCVKRLALFFKRMGITEKQKELNGSPLLIIHLLKIK